MREKIMRIPRISMRIKLLINGHKFFFSKKKKSECSRKICNKTLPNKIPIYLGAKIF